MMLLPLEFIGMIHANLNLYQSSLSEEPGVSKGDVIINLNLPTTESLIITKSDF